MLLTCTDVHYCGLMCTTVYLCVLLLLMCTNAYWCLLLLTGVHYDVLMCNTVYYMNVYYDVLKHYYVLVCIDVY